MPGAANERGRGVATSPARTRTATRRALTTALLAMLIVGALAACSSSSSKAAKRPSTNATLEVISPQPNAVVGRSVQLKFRLIGGRVVPATTAAVSGSEGHIHVSVDGKIVSMAYGLTQQVNLSPGLHTIGAEYVATDHIPFANEGPKVLKQFVVTVKK